MIVVLELTLCPLFGPVGPAVCRVGAEAMMNDLLSFCLSVLGGGVIIVLILRLYAYKLKARRQSKVLNTPVLRLPGQSWGIRIIELKDAARINALALLSGVVLIFSVHLLLSFLGGVPESFERTAVSAATALLFMVILTWRWCRLSIRRGRYRLRLQGERAVGRALGFLAQRGHRVYHEFPADSFYIGHLVVGPYGVMTVETKVRSIRSWHRRGQGPIVVYDGHALHFSKHRDYKTTGLARYRALWLSKWLSKATGDLISARAIVAVPQWSVKRTSADGIPVVNPRQFKNLFAHIKPLLLTDEMIETIARRIERRYRAAAEGPSISA